MSTYMSAAYQIRNCLTSFAGAEPRHLHISNQMTAWSGAHVMTSSFGDDVADGNREAPKNRAESRPAA